MKRNKQSSARASGSGSATGVADSDFQAARVRLEQKPNKKQLLEAAIRYLYKCLLRDLRPPWLMHTFPQALPGNGVLSKYTRPSYLQWDCETGSKLFGDAVADLLAVVSEAVNLELRGFLARPLYVCNSTHGSGGLMCMSVASMSQLMKHVEGRLHYRCGHCSKKDEDELASGSLPLGVLRL